MRMRRSPNDEKGKALEKGKGGPRNEGKGRLLG
jgi:hypothetical protein